MATYVDGRPRPFTAGAAGPEDFQSLSEHGQPLRPAVDSDSRKAYYKALNRLSKTVADLLESMGREDPRHHDTPLPQRSGLAVYVAETTAELEGARAGLCDDAEKSARTRTDIRRMLAASRGTDGSNPVPSSGESASRGIFALPRREAGFSRGCVGPAGAARSAETGIARCMAPTGGNISVGPNSSTAASMRRWLNEFRSGSGKAEHGPLLVPGKR